MFTFAWPLVFLLLPLYWIVKKYFPGNQTNDDAMLRVPFLSRLQTLNQQTTSSALPNNLKQFYALCAWTLLLIACANPQWLGELMPVQQDGRNIMLAVDLSPSMGIPDLQRGNSLINRLQSVKTVAASFIDKRQGDKLGLILFGSNAYMQTPLTFDRKTVRSMLDDATIGLAGDHTAIGDALGLAVKKFAAENVNSRILILLTDGGNNTGVIDPMDAADMAKQNKIKIYTVGIGASQLAISTGFGTQMINPSADLDENLLRNIANKTDGQYFRAEDQAALNNILESINKLEPVSAESKVARPITALFYWPLGLALLFFTLIIFPLHVKLRR
jgi:Ca-activated chloride channel family protein